MPGGEVVLVDTGPLVALFDPSDADHQACREQLGRLRRSRLVTCLAVVTEATHLLAFSVAAQTAMLGYVGSGAIELEDMSAVDVQRASALMQRYSSLPMDFADATLVVLAEKLNTQIVMTLDRRDFSVYRVGRRAFRLLPSA